MERQNEIQKLDSIASYVRQYELRLAAKIPAYMIWFGSVAKWERQQEINRKCLEYWKLRFNKIAELIKY